MRKLLTTISILAALTFSASAQTATNGPVIPTNTVGLSIVLDTALSWLPYWDKNLHSFTNHELVLEASPVWKTLASAGSTPFVSLGGDYFITRNIGLGGEVITFGNGAGSSSLDSIYGNLTLRKDVGNVAAYLLFSPGYDNESHKFSGGFGPGIEFRYQTGFSLFVDSRFTMEGVRDDQKGWLTRVGLRLKF